MITDIINFVTFGCNLQRIITNMSTRTINDSHRLCMVFDSLIERLKHESESLLIVIAPPTLRWENNLMADKTNWISVNNIHIYQQLARFQRTGKCHHPSHSQKPSPRVCNYCVGSQCLLLC
jgi:hypothetical protein